MRHPEYRGLWEEEGRVGIHQSDAERSRDENAMLIKIPPDGRTQKRNMG